MGGPNDRSNQGQGPAGGASKSGNYSGPPEDRGTKEQNRNQRNVVREARVRAVEDFIDRPKVGFDDSATVNLLSPKSIIRGIVSTINPLAGVLTSIGPFDNKQFFTEKVLNRKNPPDDFYDEDDYDKYISDRMSGKIDAYGNRIDSTGGNNQDTLPPVLMTQQAPSITEPEEELTELQQMLADRGSRARRFAAGGGIMNEDIIGGEFDFESARQMYGLGKLVKKATRAVKKVASSPIGKAAIAYGLTGGLGNLASGQRFFSNFFSPTQFLAKQNLGNIFTKAGAKNILFGQAAGTAAGPFSYLQKGVPKATAGLIGSGGKFSALKGITAASILPLLGIGTGDESEEEAQAILDNTGIDINKLRNDETYRDSVIARRYKAEGGPAEGKEPVAKKVMPLLDMDGMEKDYRETGGFVPIGRMEKADDVPARLSKNEFVFTADAVRNAGDGDIDKGAEVMYNMMKHLEDGGDVSKESQGLEGARNMFQTSQRLEEVL
jgi:hypothetical protein